MEGQRTPTVNCRGRLLDLTRPNVMGILNITPDSFYDGGAYMAPESAVLRAEQMVTEGATMIDMGAFSSRPGSSIVEVSEELDRLLPVLDMTLKQFPDTIISVDTCRASVAEMALEMGAHMINDITAGTYDRDMAATVAHFGAPIIAMHMQGTPGDMQKNPQYRDVVHDIMMFFVERVRSLRESGVADIIVDPGFGFGKTVAHNYCLLNALNVFKILEAPVLVGLSRKSMICRVLDVPPAQALNGTTALHIMALQKGASILRAHDVQEATEAIKLFAYASGIKPNECGENAG